MEKTYEQYLSENISRARKLGDATGGLLEIQKDYLETSSHEYWPDGLFKHLFLLRLTDAMPFRPEKPGLEGLFDLRHKIEKAGVVLLKEGDKIVMVLKCRYYLPQKNGK